MLAVQDKQFLLNLARTTFENKESNISEIPESVKEKGATFVSIYRDNKLINSIGSIFPEKEIFQDVIDSILILSRENNPDAKIEISIIKSFKKLKFNSEQDLFSQITPNIHGIAIEKNKRISTLLPSVWNQINNKEEFLNQICYKMKLEKDAWKTNADVYIYETETFRE